MTATVINEMNEHLQDPVLPALERVTQALAELLRLDDDSSLDQPTRERLLTRYQNLVNAIQDKGRISANDLQVPVLMRLRMAVSDAWDELVKQANTCGQNGDVFTVTPEGVQFGEQLLLLQTVIDKFVTLEFLPLEGWIRNALRAQSYNRERWTWPKR